MHAYLRFSYSFKETQALKLYVFVLGELYEDNTKMLMSNLGAQAPIMEEDEDEFRPITVDKNETDEEKKKRQEGNRL